MANPGSLNFVEILILPRDEEYYHFKHQCATGGVHEKQRYLQSFAAICSRAGLNNAIGITERREIFTAP
jgi:hypothetical protein